MTVYRCNACDHPADGLPPCVCMIDANLGAPVGCLYSTSRAARPAEWKVVGRDLAGIILDGLQGGA